MATNIQSNKMADESQDAVTLEAPTSEPEVLTSNDTQYIVKLGLCVGGG